jgi:hypothetical protein
MENKLPRGPHAPTPEPSSSSDGCPGPCHSGYIFSQLLVSLHVRCLLAQVHQKRLTLVGLLRIALVPALRVLPRTCPCHDAESLARASTSRWSSPASVRFSRSGRGCCRTRKPLRTHVRVGSPGHRECWPLLSQSRRRRRPAFKFLIMTADSDSSRSPRLLFLLTVR